MLRNSLVFTSSVFCVFRALFFVFSVLCFLCFLLSFLVFSGFLAKGTGQIFEAGEGRYFELPIDALNRLKFTVEFHSEISHKDCAFDSVIPVTLKRYP